jgi:S-adenosylmethionine-diacylgycerolhomoserine-N-methlytransferase
VTALPSATPQNRLSAGGHAGLMDRIYRHQRHIYNLTRKYYLLGRDQMIRELKLAPGEHVIEIGCGTARNLIHIAKRYPGVRLYGLDASAEMLATARESVRRHGLEDRIVLAQGLAEEMAPALFGRAQPFDRALFPYSLSMIPDWRGALQAAARSVKAEGFVHIVDFGDLKGLWAPAARLLRAWLRLFHVAPREEILCRLEATPGAHKFALLPGRYAFVADLSPSNICEI